MKYFVTIGDHEFEIEIDNGDVIVDGETVDVDLARSGVPELYSALVDGSSYEVLVEDLRQQYLVTLQGEQYQVHVEDERTRRLNLGRQGPELPQGDLPVRAPIPGLVVKILVQEGEEISEDQPLIILEAMKMENEIRALRAGVIRRIDVSTGERVDQNAQLLVIG